MIARNALSDNACQCNIREKAAVTKAFALMWIADVYQNQGDLACQYGVAQGDACVRECGWVEDDSVNIVMYRLMNAINECVLGIALKKFEGCAAGLVKCLVQCL